MSESKSTLPQLFIIESLGLGDERKERFEGRVLKHISGPRRKRVDVLLHPDETRTRKDGGALREKPLSLAPYFMSWES